MSDQDELFSWDDTQEVFATLAKSGWRLIVVGGQAVNFWVQWCERETGANFGSEPFASKDIDLVGNKKHVELCAALLNGKAHIPGPDHMTPEQGYVEATVSSGRTVRIDFLSDSLPNNAKEIDENALPFTAPWGEFYVMDPVACMKTRVFNVVHLASKYDNPHGLRQLRASIQVIAEFCRALLARSDVENPVRIVLDIYKEVFVFSADKYASKLWKSHSIDVFEAIQPLEGLPEEFKTKAYPRWLAKIAAARQKATSNPPASR